MISGEEGLHDIGVAYPGIVLRDEPQSTNAPSKMLELEQFKPLPL